MGNVIKLDFLLQPKLFDLRMNMNETNRADMQDGFDQVVYGVTHRQLDARSEKDARYSLAKGEYGTPGSMSYDIVLSWLASNDTARAAESLSISRKALSNSHLATRIAIFAVLISIIMAAQKIIELSFK